MTVVEAVTVNCRWGAFAGTRRGRVAAYEFESPAGRERSYLLLDEHIQLRQPQRWTTFQQGWWYIDLVEITEDGRQVDVRDWYIDLIVPPHGPYRVIDLDEFGAAIVDGFLSPEQAAVGLQRLQAFLDRHMHRPDDPAMPWRDFPPAALDPLLQSGAPPHNEGSRWA